MTKQEHIAEATRLVNTAAAHANRDREWAAISAQLAQVHATLAVALGQDEKS